MTQIQNIINNDKNDNIIYALEDLERNENDTMKMYEAVKKSNDRLWLMKFCKTQGNNFMRSTK